jgi:hypothetical protein
MKAKGQGIYVLQELDDYEGNGAFCGQLTSRKSIVLAVGTTHGK